LMLRTVQPPIWQLLVWILIGWEFGGIIARGSWQASQRCRWIYIFASRYTLLEIANSVRIYRFTGELSGGQPVDVVNLPPEARGRLCWVFGEEGWPSRLW